MTHSRHIDTNPYELIHANLEWLDAGTPFAKQYDDIYFSSMQGLQETQYVFLQQNHLAQRWQALDDSTANRPQHFSIAETGFGTGLNFLAAWQLWQKLAPNNWHLHYVSVEKHPLRLEDLTRALAQWDELSVLAKQLISAYPTLIPGHHTLHFDNDRVHLHLLLGDAAECFEQLRVSSKQTVNTSMNYPFDAWFLDGFTPSKNPQMWNHRLYKLMADLSKPGTTLATFTSAGDVRRALIAHGFSMTKVAGFNHKREMLRGTFTGNGGGGTNQAHEQTHTSAIDNIGIDTKSAQPTKTPWYVRPKTHYQHKHATVIGAGLAGTGTAYALAQRGWQVTLIDRHSAVAQQASGNAQGMLYTKLSPKHSDFTHFSLSSYLFALRFYQQLAQNQLLKSHQYRFCGLLQLVNNANEQKNFDAVQQLLHGQPQLVQFLNASQASAVSATTINCPAYYFPHSGWVSPRKLCQQLSQHPLITPLFHSDAMTLHAQTTAPNQQAGWHVYDKNHGLLSHTNAVIIANSVDALQFEQSQHLPLRFIRGQVSEIPALGPLADLQTVLCHDGYITPASNGKNSIGATFDIGNRDTKVHFNDHQRNLASLSHAIPSLMPNGIDSIDTTAITGRAGLRCTSPDYLPLVGQLPNHTDFLNDYARLRKDANWSINKTGSYYKGLYINTAYGSRGLTCAPLCCELLAAIINAEPMPMPRQLVKALNPARFLIRSLIKNKI